MNGAMGLEQNLISSSQVGVATIPRDHSLHKDNFAGWVVLRTLQIVAAAVPWLFGWFVTTRAPKGDWDIWMISWFCGWAAIISRFYWWQEGRLRLFEVMALVWTCIWGLAFLSVRSAWYPQQWDSPWYGVTWAMTGLGTVLFFGIRTATPKSRRLSDPKTVNPPPHPQVV